MKQSALKKLMSELASRGHKKRRKDKKAYSEEQARRANIYWNSPAGLKRRKK